LFKKKSIEAQYIVTYAPEQNGTAEKKNWSWNGQIFINRC